MRKWLFATAVVSVLTLGGLPRATAQNETNPVVPEPAKKSPPTTTKPMTMGGQMNEDGTLFIADKDLKTYKIMNPSVARGHLREHVTIVAREKAAGELTVQSIRKKSQKFS